MLNGFQRLRQSSAVLLRGLIQTHRGSYRLICLLAGVLVPTFGVAYRLTEPGAVDSFWHRGLVAMVPLTLAIASYQSAWVRQRLDVLTRGMLYFITLWFVVLTTVNQFAAPYAIGLLFVFAAAGAAFSIHLRQAQSLVYYLVFGTATASLAILGVSAPQTNVAIFIFCVFSLAIVLYVTSHLTVQAHRRSAENEQRFRAAIEGSLDAFFLLYGHRDADGQLTHFELIDMNNRAEEFAGGSRFDVLGQSLRELLPLYRDENAFEQLVHVAETGYPLEAKFETTREDKMAWIRHQVVQVDDSIAVTLRDITARKKSELETARLKNFYEQIMDHMPAEVAVFNRDREYVYVNPQAVSEPEVRRNLIGRTDAEYCHWRGKDPMFGKRRMKRLQRVIDEKATIRFEERLEGAEGQTLHFMRVLSPIIDMDGTVTQVLGYGIDITELKEAEEAVRASERRYRTLMDAANDAIFVSDPDTGCIVEANRRAQELVGYSLGELREMSYADLHSAEDHNEQPQAFRRYVMEDTDPPPNVRVTHRDGHEIPVEVSANLIEVEEQRLLMAIFRDVTARRRYEEQLIEARERAEEMLQLKSDILNNVSHEIRTPLTGILGFADVLVENSDGEDQEFAEIIAQNAQRLQETLNSVLDMARLERGEIIVEADEVNVLEEAREALSILYSRAADKDLALSVEGTPVHAHLDATCLHRIVNNLVGNAIKFTDEGSVTVSVEGDDEQVCLKVADTGRGIREDFLPHLFDEFRQESGGLDRDHEGSGLGLAITKRLVELMNGTISVESEVGEGTTFTVSLPREPETISTECEAPNEAGAERAPASLQSN